MAGEGSDSGDKTKSPGLQRVYTTNLVAYASDHQEGYRAEQIMNDLAEKHPGRYILIRPAADKTEAPVSAIMSLDTAFLGVGARKKSVAT